MNINDKEYLELTRELVAIPSVSSDLSAMQTAVDFCEKYFSHFSFLKTKKIFSNGKPSLIVGSNTETAPKIVMIGHLDVVPAPLKLFSVRQEGSLFYGRGVCDMKGSVAIMMSILREVLEKDPAVSVGLWLTTDEEIGGVDGVRYLVEVLHYKPQVALVPDGGSAPETVVLKSKGLLPLKMRANGLTSHASRPWEGESAISKLIVAYHQIERLFPDGKNKRSDKKINDHWYSTAVMTTIRGGEANNVVPKEAECLIDVRLTEDVDINTLRAEILEIARSYDVAIDILAEIPVSSTEKQNPYVQLYKKIVIKETGKSPSFIAYPGTNDSRYLTKHGIPAIVSRPRGGGQHRDDEWVDLGSMEEFYKIYSRFITTAAQKV